MFNITGFIANLERAVSGLWYATVNTYVCCAVVERPSYQMQPICVQLAAGAAISPAISIARLSLDIADASGWKRVRTKPRNPARPPSAIRRPPGLAAVASVASLR